MSATLYIADTKGLDDPKLFESLYELLPKWRKKKVCDKRTKNDRELSLAAGLLFMTALEKENISADDEEIAEGIKDKPYLKNRPEIFFNLSHSGSKALCLISDTESGCDVERVRDYNPKLASFVCSERQLALIGALPEAERAEEFIRLWTMKESYMKATGGGIGIRASTIEFPLEGYSVYTYNSVDGHCISCCIGGENALRPELIEIKPKEILGGKI